jgi:hypothetical protein
MASYGDGGGGGGEVLSASEVTIYVLRTVFVDVLESETPCPVITNIPAHEYLRTV